MKKFWVVHNIPSPYRLHIFNALWRECQKRGLDFHVHFMSDMSRGYEERPLSWRNPKMDFPYTYWRDYGVGQRHANPGLLWHLWREQPDYLLSGSPFDTLTGMFVGRFLKGVACTWAEGNTKQTGEMGGVKGWIKRSVLSSFDYVAVPGQDGAKYIALHQERTDKRLATPVMLPNLIDETRFVPRDRYPQTEIGRVRVSCGALGDERLAILPCRFVWEKGLIELMQILTPEMVSGWHLVIIGDGVQRAECERLMSGRGLDEYITVISSVEYSEMPKYYAAADLLLLPSQKDQNPLSVVEALHCGLPIAISSEAGNIDDALTEGQNGWRLPVKDRGAFTAKLTEVFAASKEQLKAMGTVSNEVNASFWGTEKSIREFVDVIVKE